MAVLPEVYIEIESPNLYQFLEMSVHQIRDDFPKTLFSYMKTYILWGQISGSRGDRYKVFRPDDEGSK
jgi:hypothetical protein